MSQYHTPVMLQEVLDGLAVQPGKWYIDATLGGGGHTEAILQAGGRVLGLDQDLEALAEVEHRLADYVANQQLRLYKANFRDITEVIGRLNGEVTGVLMDLGLSSHQLDEPSRGFSFNSDTLDMRMDTSQGATAADLLARLSATDLYQLFADFGQERYARVFAEAVALSRQERPITTAAQLAELIKQHSPMAYRYGHIHPATRVFQSLRMAVNDELGSLQQALPQAIEVLCSGGKIAVISFHSLEDRLVKQAFNQSNQLTVLTRKPIVPTTNEVKTNPRSRSAKLRLGQKL